MNQEDIVEIIKKFFDSEVFKQWEQLAKKDYQGKLPDWFIRAEPYGF